MNKRKQPSRADESEAAAHRRAMYHMRFNRGAWQPWLLLTEGVYPCAFVPTSPPDLAASAVVSLAIKAIQARSRYPL